MDDDTTGAYSPGERITRLEINMANTAHATAVNAQAIADTQHLLNARPSWAVTMLVSVLMSMCVGLATMLAAVIGHV